MVLKGFSYSKLTELQVQGARDRSRRQIESSQLNTRLEQARRKWKAALLEQHKRQQQDDDLPLFQKAIHDVYEKDPVKEISPFMAARLAELCRQEFKNAQREKALEQIYKQHRDITHYLCQEIDEYGKEKNRIKQELKKRVEAMKNEIEDMKKRTAEEMRANVAWKKQELFKLRASIMMRIEELEKKDWSQVQEPVLIKKCIDGAEWIDIDEDYFPTKGVSSGWVVCSQKRN
jgi:hypothetical protein